MKIKKGNLIFAFAMFMVILLLFVSASIRKDYYGDGDRSQNLGEVKSNFEHINYLVLSDIQNCDISFEPSNNVTLISFGEPADNQLTRQVKADTLFLFPNKSNDKNYNYINILLSLPEDIHCIQANNSTLTARGNEAAVQLSSTVKWMIEGGSLTFMPANNAYDKPFYFANHDISADKATIMLASDQGYINSFNIELSNYARFDQSNENAFFNINAFSIKADEHSQVNIPGYLFNKLIK